MALRVTLVNPPKSDVVLAELAPPLGLLQLAGIARSVGCEPVICDLNMLWHLDAKMRASFYETALDLLLASGSNVFAFSSMCVDSHVALELARRLKKYDAGLVVVLGGPHFSSIAREIKSNFPYVDYVVEGEGETPFANLLANLSFGMPNADSSSGSLLHTISRGRPADLPWNGSGFGYDLVDLRGYFALNNRRITDFETGRGCRFKCAFCYSPGHYSTVRVRGISDVLSELARAKALGFKRFSFVDDNFLNSSDRAIEFCHALCSEKLAIRWQSYATFPQVTETLTEAMSLAGCDRIFTGIDAVGTAAQHVLRKAFYPSAKTFEAKLRMLIDHRITPTCAFILCPPSFPGGRDIEFTIRAALSARICGASIRLNTLTLYNGTPASAQRQQLETDDLKARLMLDVPPIVECNKFASKYPNLFPFHSRYVPRNEWNAFLQLAHCLSSILDTFPRTLDMVWKNRGISPIDVARRILFATGDLSSIAKRHRRPHEQVCGYDVLKELVVEHDRFNTLEAESPFVESYD